MYDFRTGSTANYMEAEIRKNSLFNFEPVQNIDFRRIKVVDGRYMYKEHENEYLMFAYLDHYHVDQYGTLPKFHTIQCETRNTYGGFSFTSQMPVDIYNKDTGQNLLHQKLEWCKNCQGSAMRNVFNYLAGNSGTWYQYVIDFASSGKPGSTNFRKDGYATLWKQVSEAIRVKNNYTCKTCGLTFNKRDDYYYLEVHHKNRNKADNREANLEPLCVLCHATVDSHHLANFRKGNPLKVDQFIRKFKSSIPSSSIRLWDAR